ncbi:hypothetical protein [Caulobacter segnis]|uniref:Uncharacterized protein n=1 Tax=Caulobacter segnis TaxID=88688 RepID=A0A2W5VGF7_9CAUL|nr:hypothetical protein [Caulobacter segnis]PZR35696.1 MAG: hypothetical protein DI526_06155 [Caulobacter segnis]
MRSDLFPDPLSHASVDECGPPALTRGERVLLWLLRQWVTARVLGQEPGERLSREAGALISPRVAAAFILMMTTIEGQVRRPLCVAAPGRQGYAEDEQRLVTACGICPASPEIAGRLLESLVIAPESVIVTARFLNMALAQEALTLPVRFEEPEYARTKRPTLH